MPAYGRQVALPSIYDNPRNRILRYAQNIRRFVPYSAPVAASAYGRGLRALRAFSGGESGGYPPANKRAKVVATGSKARAIRNGNYTPGIKQVKRKKAKKSKPAFSQKEKKSIKRIAKNVCSYKTVLDKWQQTFSEEHVDYNKVARLSLDNFADAESIITNCDWVVRDTGSTSGGTNTQAISINNLDGQKLKHARTVNYKINNNTNTQCELVIYRFRCHEYTSTSPITELEAMRSAAYSQASVSPGRADDFALYDSVPGQKRELWSVDSKTTFNLKGGETTTHFRSDRTVTIDVNRWIEEGKPTYVPGMTFVVFRMMGRVTHANNITTAANASHMDYYANIMTESCQLDIYKHIHDVFKVHTAADVLKRYEINAPTGLFTPLDGTVKPVSADPENPGLGPSAGA